MRDFSTKHKNLLLYRAQSADGSITLILAEIWKTELEAKELLCFRRHFKLSELTSAGILEGR